MVNLRSQVDNDNDSNTFLARFLERMNTHMEKISRNTERSRIDVDIYRSEPGVTGAIPLDTQVKRPWMLTDILATWETPDAAVNQTVQAVANPGAGLNATYTNNTNTSQIVLAAEALFTAGAGVANRIINVNFLNAASQVVAQIEDANLVVASSTLQVGAYQGATQQNSAGNGPPFTVPLPMGGFELLPGWSIQFQAVNIQAADTWTNILITLGTPTCVVTITIDDRTITPDPLTGIFSESFSQGMQIGVHKKFNFQVTPPVPCHFELMGYADYRKLD